MAESTTSELNPSTLGLLFDSKTSVYINKELFKKYMEEDNSVLERCLLHAYYRDVYCRAKAIYEAGFSTEMQNLPDKVKAEIFCRTVKEGEGMGIVDIIDDIEASTIAYWGTIGKQETIELLYQYRKETRVITTLLAAISQDIRNDMSVALFRLECSEKAHSDDKHLWLNLPMWDNEEFVSLAVSKGSARHYEWFGHVSNRLRSDKSFIMSQLKKEKLDLPVMAIVGYCPELYDDEEVAIVVLTTIIPKEYSMSLLVSFFTPRVKLLLRDIIIKVI
jgi:hypothetical protein